MEVEDYVTWTHRTQKDTVSKYTFSIRVPYENVGLCNMDTSHTEKLRVYIYLLQGPSSTRCAQSGDSGEYKNLSARYYWLSLFLSRVLTAHIDTDASMFSYQQQILSAIFLVSCTSCVGCRASSTYVFCNVIFLPCFLCAMIKVVPN